MNPIIFHKSSCITCKNVISEIERMRTDVGKRDFFKKPFSESELKRIIKLSGRNPKEFLRKKDKKYKELNLDKTDLSNSQIIKLLVKYPGLIKRPIIIKNEKIFLGKIETNNLK